MTPHIISKSQWVHEFHIICLYNANKHLMERWIHVNRSSAVAFGALKCFIWLYLSINCLYILSWIFNYSYYLHTPVTKSCLMAQNGPMCLMTCKLLDIDLMYILVISPFHYSKSYDVAVKYNGVRHATVTMLAIVVKADFFLNDLWEDICSLYWCMPAVYTWDIKILFLDLLMKLIWFCKTRQIWGIW